MPFQVEKTGLVLTTQWSALCKSRYRLYWRKRENNDFAHVHSFSLKIIFLDNVVESVQDSFRVGGQLSLMLTHSSEAWVNFELPIEFNTICRLTAHY